MAWSKMNLNPAGDSAAKERKERKRFGVPAHAEASNNNLFCCLAGSADLPAEAGTPNFLQSLRSLRSFAAIPISFLP
jgi:hypothetical protein